LIDGAAPEKKGPAAFYAKLKWEAMNEEKKGRNKEKVWQRDHKGKKLSRAREKKGGALVDAGYERKPKYTFRRGRKRRATRLAAKKRTRRHWSL